MILEIDGIPVHVTRKPVRHLNIRVYPPDATVKASAPFTLSTQTIHSLLAKRSAWIQSQRERLLTISRAQAQSFNTGSRIEFQGKKYLFIVVEHQGPSCIQIKEEIVYCYTTPSSSQEKIETLVDQWYRKQLNHLLPELVDKWQKIMGVHAKAWGIKKMKTRWGSCNIQAQRIWLNLNLIKKPTPCLECVMVHELVHLLETRHNARFYLLMSQFMPNWRFYDKLLNQESR